jgi:NAD(P)H-dependent FMN reductase
MRILVINGSPKGKNSVTLQTVNYLQILHPEHQFDILHAGQTIKALEKDFSPAVEAIAQADVLLFSYPVYTFIAPCQLHRFIELLKEAKLDLSAKYATQLSTSKHFYDMTAHRYIQDNCGDLGLRYIKGLSADMDDLTLEKGRKEAESYFDFLCWSVEHDSFEPVSPSLPTGERVPVTVPETDDAEKSGDIVIVADLREDRGSALMNRICQFLIGGDHGIVSHGELIAVGHALRGHIFMLHDDQPGGFGAGGIIGDKTVIRPAMIRFARSHGRHDDPVSQFKSIDFDVLSEHDTTSRFYT